jgi:hypothetical protein
LLTLGTACARAREREREKRERAPPEGSNRSRVRLLRRRDQMSTVNLVHSLSSPRSILSLPPICAVREETRVIPGLWRRRDQNPSGKSQPSLHTTGCSRVPRPHCRDGESDADGGEQHQQMSLVPDLAAVAEFFCGDHMHLSIPALFTIGHNPTAVGSVQVARPPLPSPPSLTPNHVVRWNGKDTPCVTLELECVTVGAIASTSTHRS